MICVFFVYFGVCFYVFYVYMGQVPEIKLMMMMMIIHWCADNNG